MAKIFVSGQIGDIPVVQRVQAALMAAGHEITHDWTRNEGGSKMLVGQQTKFDQAAESARRATNDMNGVVESDVYVICTDNEKAGKGMYVELGGALALNTAHHEFIYWVNASMQQSFISIPRFACATR